MQKKKNIFRRRGFAIIFCLALILSSMALSVNRSLGAKCQEVTNLFYVGVPVRNSLLKRPSIETQLKNCGTTANALLTVTAPFDDLNEDSEALRAAVNGLYQADSIKDKYTANNNLARAFYTCVDKLEQRSLSERTQMIMETCIDEFQAAQLEIESSGYNDAVREFYRDTLNVFPANYLKWMIDGKLPDLFE